MRYQLENDLLRVEIDSFGAELKSVYSKERQMEYMWQADKAFWGRTSPVLFPFVGSLKNKTFQCDDTSYSMGQHGFARDMEHTLVSKEEDRILFSLKSSEETLAKYPFEFELQIGYILTDNTVEVVWKVTNPSEDTLPFSIGAHPAFNCPIGNDESKTGYQLQFRKLVNGEYVLLDEIHHHGNTLDTGLAITEDITLKLTDGSAVITPDFFDRCTYMIEDHQANSVSIIDSNRRTYVTVEFDTPLFAIWSPEKKNAPFLCIEPWFGRCDHVDFEGDIYEREYTNFIDQEEEFQTSYKMIFA